ncbi:MAG: hypothetical protein IH830_02150 [Planctomycetes bacterium]|nr:hypothetical protein [Planctomycetota bacterium]
MPAWNGWYHIVGSTYGSWLPGDPRGWRSRHHREHVEGDYKNPPPPGKDHRRHVRSKSLMKREPVVLTFHQRELVCRTMIEALRFHHVEVKELSVSATHFHVLAGFTSVGHTAQIKHISDPPRHYVGIARSRSSRALSDVGLVQRGGLWAKRTKIVPISDPSHFHSVVEYVRRHADEGAIVWSLPREA